MNGIKYLLAAAYVLAGLNLTAQTKIRCGSDEHLQMKLKGNPNLQEVIKRMEEHTQEHIKAARLQRSVTAVTQIPVVVHLIGDAVITAVSIAKVEEQLNILNEDYRKKSGTNGDGSGVDTQIEFCLAVRNPDGEATGGVTYQNDPVGTPYPDVWFKDFDSEASDADKALKGIVHWPP